MPAPKTPSVRLFAAVFPPVELAARLAAVAPEIKLPPAAARWTRPEQIHLTLAFLGSVSAGSVPQWARAAASAAARTRPHVLEAAGLGAFPGPARPRILWAGLRGDLAVLRELKNDLDGCLQPLGYAPETREFHPHLTLGRVLRLRPVDCRALQNFLRGAAGRVFGPWPVDHLALMRSQLSASGATYSVVEAFPLSV